MMPVEKSKVALALIKLDDPKSKGKHSLVSKTNAVMVYCSLLKLKHIEAVKGALTTPLAVRTRFNRWIMLFNFSIFDFMFVEPS